MNVGRALLLRVVLLCLSIFLSSHPSVPAVCGHFNMVIIIGFLPNVIYGLLNSNPHPNMNMCFVGQTMNKMPDKMAAACQFALVDTLT